MLKRTCKHEKQTVTISDRNEGKLCDPRRNPTSPPPESKDRARRIGL